MAKTKKILIVEDEQSLLRILEKKFCGEGFCVVVALNGEDGLDHAERERPDLILLDMIMPVMDGMTMLSKLRSFSWGADIPVIALTNTNEPAQVAACLEYGVYDFLVKADWEMGDVVAKVRERLASVQDSADNV